MNRPLLHRQFLQQSKTFQIQHRDVQPVEDGYHGCVLCEYKTTKRKNLLVHLRKHNAWPLATPEYYHQQPAEVSRQTKKFSFVGFKETSKLPCTLFERLISPNRKPLLKFYVVDQL